MNKQTTGKKVAVMGKAFVSEYVGAYYDDEASFMAQEGKLDDFRRNLEKIENYLEDNKKKDNQGIVEVLVRRLEYMRKMADCVETFSYNKFDPKKETYPDDSESSIQDDDISIDGEIYSSEDSEYKKAADNFVENFNLVSGEDGTSLREEVSKFLNSIDYNTVGSEEYKILMDMVGATESMEYSFGRMSLKDDMKEMSPFLEDIIDKNDPDIKALAGLCKKNDCLSMGDFKWFLWNYNNNINSLERQLNKQIQENTVPETMASEIKLRLPEFLTKRQNELQTELTKADAVCKDYEKKAKRVEELSRILPEIEKAFVQFDGAEYSKKLLDYKKRLGYENDTFKNHKTLIDKATKELDGLSKELKSEQRDISYKTNLELSQKLKTDIDRLNNLTEDEKIIEFEKVELEKRKEAYGKMRSVVDRIEEKRTEFTKNRKSLAEGWPDVKSLKNPQADVTDKALKSIAAHLNDKKGFFHKDSDEFTAMKNDLDALNNEKDPSRKKELMERLVKSSRAYLDAKTKGGTDKNRFTANGKARQHYAEQIIKLCAEASEKNALWEADRDIAVKMQGDIAHCMKDPVFDNSMFQSVVSKEIAELNRVPRNTRTVSGLVMPKQKENTVQKKSDDIQIGPR